MSNLRRRLLLDSPQYNKSEFEFGFDKVPSEVSGDKSYVHSIKGNSLVWNQLMQNGDFSDGTTGFRGLRGTITANNGVLSFVGNDVTSTSKGVLCPAFSVIAGRKYYIQLSVSLSGGDNVRLTNSLNIGTSIWSQGYLDGLSSSMTRKAKVWDNTDITSDSFILGIRWLGAGNEEGTMNLSNIVVHDLTAIFGTDVQIAAALNITEAQITTDAGVTAFENWLADNVGTRDYYDYNPGEILNNKTEQVEVVGFNQWDEEWEVGTYDSVTGLKLNQSPWADNKIRNSNFISVLPNTTYYVGVSSFMYWEYDENKNYIKFSNSVGKTPTNGLFTTTASTYYINFIAQSDAYNNDICINLSDPSKNGTYEPYRKITIPLNLTSLKGKLLDSQGQPTGESVIISPNGLAGKDNWRDYCIIEGGYITKVVKKTGEVDLGDLGWSYTPVSSYYPYGCFRSSSIDKKISDINVLCGKYITRFDFNTDKCIFGNPGIGGDTIYVVDGDYTDVTSFKTSVTGIKLVYPLETYKTYLLDTPIPLTNRVDNGGTKRRLPEDTASAVSAPFACEVAYDTINTNTNSIERVNASEEFVYDSISIDKPVKRGILTKIKGKSLVWNQLIKNGDFSNGTTDWGVRHNPHVTLSIDRGMLKISRIGSYYSVGQELGTPHVEGHKYLVSFYYEKDKGISVSTIKVNFVDAFNGGLGYSQLVISYSKDGYYSRIYNFPTVSAKYLVIDPGNAIDTSVYIDNFQLIDLTQMFGAGNEPTTVEEFKKLYPLPYYDYNAGTLINNTTSALETVGFNLWDEEWELGGMYADGAPSTNTNQIRTKNYIPVVPNTIYYLKTKSGISQGDVHFYDINKVHLSGSWSRGNNTFTTLSDCAYIKIAFQENYGATYNHDICINLSDSSHNGEYEPYWKNTVNLNITSLTGKLNGEGDSVTIVPNGLKSAGTAYDYCVIEKGKLTKIVKCIGEVDLGTMTWFYDATNVRFYSTSVNNLIYKPTTWGVNILTPAYTSVSNGTTDHGISVYSNGRIYIKDSTYTDQDTFKASMSGVYLYYELAEPQVYILDNPVPVSLLTYKNCTVKQIPENTSTVVTATNVEVIKNQIH